MKTIKDVKKDFLFWIYEYEEGINTENSNKSNKAHKKLHSIYKECKNSDFEDIFYSLLGDKNENVRLWAAVFTLNHKSEAAEKVLEELIKLPSITSLTAEMTLVVWRRGELNLL